MLGMCMIANFNDHAANERTFLAWVRTAIGMVGFGLAIDKLGGQTAPTWLVVALLIAGIAVVAIAYLRMVRAKAQIDTPGAAEYSIARGDLFLAILIAALFVLMVLLTLRIW